MIVLFVFADHETGRKEDARWYKCHIENLEFNENSGVIRRGFSIGIIQRAEAVFLCRPGGRIHSMKNRWSGCDKSYEQGNPISSFSVHLPFTSLVDMCLERGFHINGLPLLGSL